MSISRDCWRNVCKIMYNNVIIYVKMYSREIFECKMEKIIIIN